MRMAVKLTGLLTLVLLGIAGTYPLWKTSQRSEAGDPNSDLRPPASGLRPEASASEPQEVIEVRELSVAEPVPAATEAGTTVSRSPTTSPVPVPHAQPSPYTRQLVASLTQLDFSPQSLTAEQAAQWKLGLQQLVQQGGAAVPAIQEFLEQNRDWDLGGGSPLGYPSVRAALLDALQQIGGPEAQALMLSTLQATAMPAEVARLARYLEQQSPGQFREEIGSAVRETLAQAAAGQLRGWDVGPLFQVLQDYGNEGAVADLEKNAAIWNNYSTLALAKLPAGEGVPSLIRIAEDSFASGARAAAVEALAQVAFQYPDAGAALLSLARAGKISERSWLIAAEALGGAQQFIREAGADNASLPAASGVKTYHLESSNQNFYSVPALGGMSNEQINQRVALIDQLLALSPSRAAAQALQNARAAMLASGEVARLQ